MVEVILGVIGGLSALLAVWLKWRTSNEEAQAQIDADKVKKLEAAEDRRAQEERDEFNAKVDAATTPDAAAELLREASRRSSKPR